jgi:IS30 family transposase
VARRNVTVREIGEILDHWQSGRAIRAIARSLGVCRPTIRKYVAIARSHGCEFGGLPPPVGWRPPVKPPRSGIPCFPTHPWQRGPWID